jgi:hypothetical protein
MAKQVKQQNLKNMHFENRVPFSTALEKSLIHVP